MKSRKNSTVIMINIQLLKACKSSSTTSRAFKHFTQKKLMWRLEAMLTWNASREMGTMRIDWGEIILTFPSFSVMLFHRIYVSLDGERKGKVVNQVYQIILIPIRENRFHVEKILSMKKFPNFNFYFQHLKIQPSIFCVCLFLHIDRSWCKNVSDQIIMIFISAIKARRYDGGKKIKFVEGNCEERDWCLKER